MVYRGGKRENFGPELHDQEVVKEALYSVMRYLYETVVSLIFF